MNSILFLLIGMAWAQHTPQVLHGRLVPVIPHQAVLEADSARAANQTQEMIEEIKNTQGVEVSFFKVDRVLIDPRSQEVMGAQIRFTMNSDIPLGKRLSPTVRLWILNPGVEVSLEMGTHESFRAGELRPVQIQGRTNGLRLNLMSWEMLSVEQDKYDEDLYQRNFFGTQINLAHLMYSHPKSSLSFSVGGKTGLVLQNMKGNESERFGHFVVARLSGHYNLLPLPFIDRSSLYVGASGNFEKDLVSEYTALTSSFESGINWEVGRAEDPTRFNIGVRFNPLLDQVYKWTDNISQTDSNMVQFLFGLTR